MEEKELWRNVIGFEGEYIVSNQGRVMRLPCVRGQKGEDNNSIHPGRVLNPIEDKDGYLEVKFRRNGERINKYTARIYIDGKRKTLGSFADELMAAKAYQEARKLKKASDTLKQNQ